MQYQGLLLLPNTGSDYLLEKVTERVTGTWGGGGESEMANTFREMTHSVQGAYASPIHLMILRTPAVMIRIKPPGCPYV